MLREAVYLTKMLGKREDRECGTGTLNHEESFRQDMVHRRQVTSVPVEEAKEEASGRTSVDAEMNRPYEERF